MYALMFTVELFRFSLNLKSLPYSFPVCSEFPLPPESRRRSRPHPPSSSRTFSSASSILASVGHSTPPLHLPQQVALPTLSTTSGASGEEPHHERAVALEAAGRDGRWHMLTLTCAAGETHRCAFADGTEEEVTDGRRGREREVLIPQLILSQPSHTCSLPPPSVY